jgi:hypothetical protein
MPDQQAGGGGGGVPSGRPGRAELVLRRYLVDEGFMKREQGVYWRSGGTVDVQDSRDGPGEAGSA